MDLILTENHGAVRLLRLNRPKALNALNAELMVALGSALHAADADPAVHCIVLAGGERAFAAGADIKQMVSKDFASVQAEDFITRDWEELSKLRTPVVAAVRGYALGGGCEVAMMCDLIICGQSARFGQPEITIGTIPGAGGTQRLTRVIGKAKAMDLVLTGRTMDAEEAERAGLVARVVADDQVEAEALAVAQTIAGHSRPVVQIAKEAVDRAYESTLADGLRFERRVFHSTFALDDRREGMTAFVEKRKPEWRNR